MWKQGGGTSDPTPETSPWWIKGGARDTHPLPTECQNSLIFMQFVAKNCKIIPTWEVAHRPQKNPGSAPEPVHLLEKLGTPTPPLPDQDPLAEFCVQFWSLFHEHDHLVLSKSIWSITRKLSSRLRTDRAVTRPSSEPISMRPIVDRQTAAKTLPSPAVGN